MRSSETGHCRIRSDSDKKPIMNPSSPSAPAPAQSSGVRAMFADPEPRFSVCVYCASQPGEDDAFRTTAREVGNWIARNGGQLVYGGGHTGQDDDDSENSNRYQTLFHWCASLTNILSPVLTLWCRR